MTPDLPRPYQELESFRTQLIDDVIKLSVRRELVWDFNCFDDSDHGQMAVARRATLTFVSSRIKGEPLEFSIFRGETLEETDVVDTFVGFEAHRIRDILNKLAWLDDGYKGRRLEEIRHQASQELLNLETFNDRKRQINQVLELLAA